MADRILITTLSFRYGGAQAHALRDISLEVPAGSCTALLGPTGSGKSTLLQGLAGVLGAHHSGAVAEGRLELGAEVFEGFPRRILFPRVGLFLQDPMVQISGIRRTVEEEVRFALDNLRIVDEEARHRVRLQLEHLGLEHLADRPVDQLSGGEIQRVALAGILVASPSVVLLDEPLNSLDADAQARLIRLLSSFVGKRTVVISDYGLDAALRIADRVIVLDGGTVRFQGSVAAFLTDARRFADILPVAQLAPLPGLLAQGRRSLSTKNFFNRLAEAG